MKENTIEIVLVEDNPADVESDAELMHSELQNAKEYGVMSGRYE